MERVLKSLYKVGNKIAETNYSFTFKGNHIANNKELIIKIYRRILLNSHLIQQLQEIAVRLAKIQHDNIAQFIDGDYGWQGFYFVRDYVIGSPLSAAFRKNKYFEPEKAEQIMLEILSALDAVHSTGLIHGSLSDNNIFLAEDGSTKVTDFYIDTAIRRASYHRAEMVVERPIYLAPEQIKGEMATVSSDIYTAGLIFYQLLAQNLPFKGEGITFATKHLKYRPAKIVKTRSKEQASMKDELLAEYSYLEAIVFKALQKDPLLRFKSVQEFIDSIKNKTVYEEKTQMEIPIIRYFNKESAPPQLTEETVEITSEEKKEKDQRIARDLSNPTRDNFKLFFYTFILAVTAGVIFSIIRFVFIK